MTAAVRRARGALLAAVVLGLGAGFHLMAGGALPALPLLALLAAATAAVTARLLRTPATARRIVAIAVGGQAAVHAALTATAGHGHAVAVTGGSGGAADWAPGSLGDALQAPVAAGAATDPVALAFARLAADLTPAHLPMAMAHAVAAALVGAWLARGEAALLTLLALAAPRALPRSVLLPRPARRLPVAIPTIAIPDPLLALSSPGRRGPPVVAAF